MQRTSTRLRSSVAGTGALSRCLLSSDSALQFVGRARQLLVLSCLTGIPASQIQAGQNRTTSARSSSARAECDSQGGRLLSYRLQRATKEENQPNAVEGALAPPNVAVRVQ